MSPNADSELHKATDRACPGPSNHQGSLQASFRPFDRDRSIRAKTTKSLAYFERSRKSLAGGVSSGLRRHARPYPLYFEHGLNARVFDVDGNEYLDYGLAWGPLILGHCPKEVVDAVSLQLSRGFTFGAQHKLEIEVAERLVEIIPCADAVCYSNSGTEIVQLALRIARAATGKHKYLKFEGHYHGWGDTTLVSYHPTAEEIENGNGEPIAVGTGQLLGDHVIVRQWNDFAGVEAAFASNSREISAIICEPLLCNSGCIPPRPGFLEFLREITKKNGALLIFDEVITGFRLHLRGAQGFYQVMPDLATYAKAVGAGLPLSVLAGKGEFMDLIANGEVVHAGTLNGNPLSLSAANAALKILMRDHGVVLSDLRLRGERLRRGLEDTLLSRGYGVVTTGEGAVFQVSFREGQPWSYRDTLGSDKQLYSDFALALLDEGVLVLPDGRWYMSTAHSDADVEATLAAAERAAN